MAYSLNSIEFVLNLIDKAYQNGEQRWITSSLKPVISVETTELLTNFHVVFPSFDVPPPRFRGLSSIQLLYVQIHSVETISYLLLLYSHHPYQFLTNIL